MANTIEIDIGQGNPITLTVADTVNASGTPTSRVLTAGAGLVGGGNLTADRVFAVGANADGSIQVNADDIQVGVLATDAQHGTRGGGSTHALAVASGAAGFLSGADKAKLDGIASGSDVTGPASSSDEAVARFDSTSGKLLQNSLVTVDDSGNIATPGTVDGRDVSVDGAKLDTVTVANIPSSGEKAALVGTSGTPGSGNKFVTDADVRNSNTRTPTDGSVTTAKIVDANVTLAKLENLAQDTLIGRSTPSTGTPEAIPLTAAGRALIDDVDTAAQRLTLGLGTAATQSSSAFQPADAELSALASLISAADKLPYFTGSGTAAVADFSAAGRALVDDADATAQRNTLGLGTLATQSGTFSGTSSGTNTGDQTITLTGDVTGSGGGSFTATISAGAVTNSKLAAMAAHTIKGNNTGSSASPLDLTASQVTAELNVVTGDSGSGGVKGLVPAPAAGDAVVKKMLMADGSWSSYITNFLDLQFFGTGIDGSATVTGSSDTVGTWLVSGVMQRDAHLTDLTINSSGSIDTNGFTLYGTGTLDIAAAATNAIKRTPANGNNAVSNVGVSGASAIPGRTAWGGNAGGNSAASNTTNGTSVAPTTATAVEAATGSSGGAGGTDGTRTGGNGGTYSAVFSASIRNLFPSQLATGSTSASLGGLGGGGGAGSGSLSGGGGGSGGAGGGSITISFKNINRSGSTAASCISALGGNGGNGTSPSNANTSGGGGGGGGQGGSVWVIYRALTGSSATNLIDVSGGAGGNGGNGNGSGGGATGGRGGASGAVLLWDLSNCTLTASGPTSAPSGGNSPSGATGGTGTAGATLKVSL